MYEIVRVNGKLIIKEFKEYNSLTTAEIFNYVQKCYNKDMEGFWFPYMSIEARLNFYNTLKKESLKLIKNDKS